MELVGEGVKLQTEDIRLSPDGNNDRRSRKAGQSQPLVLRELHERIRRNLRRQPGLRAVRRTIDLSIAAAFLRKHDFYTKAGWKGEILRDEKSHPRQTLAPS